MMLRARFPVIWYFLLAYLFAAIGMGLQIFASHRLPIRTWLPYAPYVLGIGPSLAGLVMTLFLYGFAGVWRLALQFHPSLVKRAWSVLAVCLLLPLGVEVVAVLIVGASGGPVPPLSSSGWSNYLFVAVLGEGFLGAGILEEIGWRGFALPHLQRRYPALMSSLIIGFVWAFWHFPNLFVFQDSIPWAKVAVYVPAVMAMSVLFTWTYNSTGGSLIAAVLLHGAIDAQLFSWNKQPEPLATDILRFQVIEGLLYAALAAAVVWRYGAVNLSWRDRVIVGPRSN